MGDTLTLLPTHINGEVTFSVPGAKVVYCTRCSQECWLAPSSIDFMKEEPEIELVCLICLAPELAEEKSLGHLRFAAVPGVSEEMQKIVEKLNKFLAP